jgi:hypothetical protein
MKKTKRDIQQLVFETPGLIDLRAFTVMGFNAKPATENPIGYFGTGLKYAISVLCRLGTKPVVWIGQDKYTFYTKTVDFRGKAFEQIWMRSQRWKLRARNAELPYTTEYGKNWQPWMVFRELESNTRDEHGRSYLAPAVEAGLEGFTIITIDNPEVVAAFNERDKVFLDPEKQPLVVGDGVVTVRQGDGNRLFYRGIRAKETAKPTVFTYDFNSAFDLTEDRTFQSEHWVRYKLGTFIAGCTNEDVIRRVLTADEKHWEFGLEIPQYVKPSDAFRRVIHNTRGLGAHVHAYYARYDNRPEVVVQSVYLSAKRPWKHDDNCIYDADGNELLMAPPGFRGRWERFAAEMVAVANFHDALPPANEPELPHSIKVPRYVPMFLQDRVDAAIELVPSNFDETVISPGTTDASSEAYQTAPPSPGGA